MTRETPEQLAERLGYLPHEKALESAASNKAQGGVKGEEQPPHAADLFCYHCFGEGCSECADWAKK